MLSALLEVWRHFRPTRAQWAHAVRVTGCYPDPPGHQAVEDAVDDVLLTFDDDDDDDLELVAYTSSWDMDRRTFRVDVFANDAVLLDRALRLLREDRVLAACDLESRVRWSGSGGAADSST